MLLEYYKPIVIVFSIFIWEYIAKKLHLSFKLSTLLNFISYHVNKWFYLAGQLFARISSFLQLINFMEFVEAITDIVWPLFKILTSFYQFVKGYADYALKTGYENMTFVGTVIILVVVLAGLYIFFQSIPVTQYFYSLIQ